MFGSGLRHYIVNLGIKILAVSFGMGTAFANPVLDNVAAGDVSVQQTATTTQVNQTSQQAIINWQSFNIGAGEVTQFVQPNANAIALNRISPNQGASQIYGQLTANGRVILVNQAGIYFGPNAVVNVAGLIASTSNISDANFMAGHYVFDQPSPYAASVINAGNISAADYGLVALVGSSVSNSGMIQAHLGNVVLASGNKFTIDLYGDQLVNFSVDEAVAQAQVNNSGTVMADGGMIIMSAKAAQGVVDNVINMNGVLQAQSVSQENGQIILLGGDEGVVNVAGKIDASGKSAGETGGSVHITGEYVLLDSANIDVSGDLGGGEILVGGDYQGSGTLAQATAVVALPNTLLNANAINLGNGGKVIIWSTDVTKFYGSISATGGEFGGNGGLAETSGHFLSIGDNASVNLSAKMGLAGTWLLDPYDLQISTSGDVNYSISSGIYTPSGAGSNVNYSTLQNALNTGNVTLKTTSAGTGSGDITVNYYVTYNSPYTFTLSAYRNVVLNYTIQNNGAGSVYLVADNTSIGVGTVCGYGGYCYAGGISSGYPGYVIANTGRVYAFYNPQSFGTAETIYYDGYGTNVIAYMLINSLGGQNDTTGASLATFTNQTSSGNGNFTGGNFALAKDIDASATSGWSNGFKPISSYSGNFSGGGHILSNLTVNTTSAAYNGLFAYKTGGSIRDLGLTNVNISKGQYNGGLAGAINNTLVNNVYTTGTVDGTYYNNYYTGGLFGYAAYTTITNAYSTASIIAGSGLIGYSDNSTVSKSYSAGVRTNTGSCNDPFVCSGYGSYVNNFYDQTLNSDSSSFAIGKTTSQMKTASTFTGAGWDFTTIWAINANEYPHLQILTPAAPVVPVTFTGTSQGATGQTISIAVNGITLSGGVFLAGNQPVTNGSNQYTFILDSALFSFTTPFFVYSDNATAGSAVAVSAVANAISMNIDLHTNTVDIYAPGATLSATDMLTAKGSLSPSNNLYTNSSGQVSVKDNSSFIVNGATSTFNVNTQMITPSGPVTYTFNGPVTYGSFINSGTGSLTFNSSVAMNYFQLGGGNNAVTVGGTLTLGQTSQINVTAFLLGAVDMGTFNLSFNPSSAGSNAAGAISGTGGTLSINSGTVTLSATNNYTGPTSINSNVVVTANGAFGTTAGTTSVNSGNLTFQNVSYTTAAPTTPPKRTLAPDKTKAFAPLTVLIKLTNPAVLVKVLSDPSAMAP